MRTSTATSRKPAEPDWSAIHRGMNARQREAFNAFHERLFLAAETLRENLRGVSLSADRTLRGMLLEDALNASKQLDELIDSIPWLWK